MTASTLNLAELNRSALTLFVLMFGLRSELPAAPLAVPESHPFRGLLQNSPFGQPPTTGASEQGNLPNHELEFRGVVVEGEQSLFNIFDPVVGKSCWIPLNHETDGLLVATYDAKSDQITVAQKGQLRRLELKRAIIGSQPSAAPDNETAAASPPVPEPGQKRRLSLIREELRRRASEIAGNNQP